MSKLIQKAGFLNLKRAGRYMNYIATRDGVELLENFSICQPDRVIFTKVDETGTHGIILNILHRRKVALSYITNGQSVPDDIEPASVERLAELLLR